MRIFFLQKQSKHEIVMNFDDEENMQNNQEIKNDGKHAKIYMSHIHL